MNDPSVDFDVREFSYAAGEPMSEPSTPVRTYGGFPQVPPPMTVNPALLGDWPATGTNAPAARPARAPARTRKTSTTRRAAPLTKADASPAKRPRKVSVTKKPPSSPKKPPSTPKKASAALPEEAPPISPVAARTVKLEAENPTTCIRCGFEAGTIDGLQEHSKKHIGLRNRASIFPPKYLRAARS